MPRLEHRGIIGGLAAGEVEIGPAETLEGGEGIGHAVVPGARQRRLELFEAAQRNFGEQLVAVAEMPVGRRRADAGQRAASAKVKPAGPFAAISSSAARSGPPSDCRGDSRGGPWSDFQIM